MRRLLSILAVAATVIVAAAQSTPRDSAALIRLSFHESDFYNYRITTTTSMKRFFPRSDLPSEYSRELTYFVSQRVTSIGKDGIVAIEANVDSMREHVDKPGDELTFDSQQFLSGTSTVSLNHPELIGPSMILNKPFTYRITLEGDFIDLKGFESWIGQIDSAVTLDTMVRFSMEEYMSPAFLRTLVMPHEGFIYGRRYTPKQEWPQAAIRSVFSIPVVDSARYRIEIPSTHKRFFLFTEGRLFPRGREIRDHGFKETSLLDSVRGTMLDTTVIAGQGHVQELERTTQLRAYLHTAQLSYSEDIRESTVVRLEGYEPR